MGNRVVKEEWINEQLFEVVWAREGIWLVYYVQPVLETLEDCYQFAERAVCYSEKEALELYEKAVREYKMFIKVAV